MTALLHDRTVLDCSQGLSGPFCVMLLGDLGTRVPKVESLEGDLARQFEPRQGNHSAVFLALHRNTESLGIARHTAAGQEILHRLVRRADIVIGLGVGPMTGLFLAELGAEVIKVEPPHGDPALTVLPRQRGTSVLYISANLCKRGVILHLKAPRDLERAYHLAERSDVFLENFRVGVVGRLGLGCTTLTERNPRLIYCSLSGFGPVGPLARLPSVDPYIL